MEIQLNKPVIREAVVRALSDQNIETVKLNLLFQLKRRILTVF
jgi:hypothetical protein